MDDSRRSFINRYIKPYCGLYTLCGIIVVAAALRCYLAFTAAGINSDAWRFALTARKMAEEGLLAGMRGDFLWPYYPVNRNLILFPYLGSLLLPVTGNAILCLRIVSLLAGVGLVPLGYAVTNRLLGNKCIATLAALLLAVHSEFARTSVAVFREVLMAFVVTFAFYLVLRIIQADAYPYLCAVGAGIVLFLGFVNRPEGGIVAPLCGLIVLFVGYAGGWRKRIKLCMAMALGFLALQAPYTLWMKNETGMWLLNQWQVQTRLNESSTFKAYVDERGTR